MGARGDVIRIGALFSGVGMEEPALETLTQQWAKYGVKLGFKVVPAFCICRMVGGGSGWL